MLQKEKCCWPGQVKLSQMIIFNFITIFSQKVVVALFRIETYNKLIVYIFKDGVSS